MTLYLNIDLQEPDAELGPKFDCIFLGRPSQKHNNSTPILSVHNRDLFPSHEQLFHCLIYRLTHFFCFAEKLLSLVVLLCLSSNSFLHFLLGYPCVQLCSFFTCLLFFV